MRKRRLNSKQINKRDSYLIFVALLVHNMSHWAAPNEKNHLNEKDNIPRFIILHLYNITFTNPSE